MYLGRRKTGSEYLSHIRKFLNHTNDPLRRLKSLRSGLDKMTVSECKQTLTEYSAPAYYVFHASFTAMENLIREKVTKGRTISDQLREMMEVILPSLERLIILLPELVQEKWQYNSICLVIRKLLHPENSIELRQWGIKLIVLWLQALQDKAGDACIELWASAIPHFPPNKTPMGLPMETTSVATPTSSHSLCERYGQYSTAEPAKDHDWVSTQVIHPLCYTQTASTDPAVSLMEYLLTCLTSQVGRLKWTDPSNHTKGFSFLFFQFKLFYLVCLYKNFRSDAGLYSTIPPPVIKLPLEDMVTPPTPPTVKVREEAEGVWQKQPSSSKHVSSVSAVIKLDYDTSAPVYQTLRHLVLRYVLKWIMPGLQSNRPGSIQPKVASPSPLLSEEHHTFTPDPPDMMREMWLSSRDNINLLFEICHQAFQLPLHNPGVVNKLTELYSSWVQSPNRPLFMETPPSVIVSLPVGQTNPIPPAPSLSVLPWEVISGYSKFDRSDVRAGLQASLKMFMSHTSQLFLHEPKQGTQLENQVESGRRILKLYQEIAQLWIMDGETWLYLLTILLHLTLKLLYETLPPPDNRDSTLGGNLANLILQTLLVSYVRCSMVMTIPNEYWDNLWSVLSSLTQWKEVIHQWSEVMKSLTQCLARVVYELDLDSLPLKHLAEEGHRPRTRTMGSTSEWIRKKSFSEYLPPPCSNSSVVNFHSSERITTDRKTSSRILSKASTVELHSAQSSPLAVPGANEKRRASSPAMPRPHFDPSSSVPLTKKELSNTEEKQLTILEQQETQETEEEEEELGDKLPIISSQIDLDPINEEDDVIVNRHTVPSPVPSPEPPTDISINLLSPSGTTSKSIADDITVTTPSDLRVVDDHHGSVVISNEDVSTSDSGQFMGEDHSMDTLPTVSTLRRSLSDGSSINKIKRQVSLDVTSRSQSPDPRIITFSSSPNSSSFSHYIPERSLEATPPQTTPIIWSPSGDKSSSPLTEVLPDINKPKSLSWRSVSPTLYKPHPQAVRGEGHWTPISVSFVWQNMCRILSDINRIDSPVNQALALQCVAEIWSKLHEIVDNLGISMDSKFTPPLPDFIPPLQIFLPWVVKACNLSHDYKEGRKLAYRLLCDMVLQHNDCTQLSTKALPHFYRLVHSGLQPISDVINVTVKSGCRLLSYGFVGSSILLHDCLVASSHLLNSKTPEVPRLEALTLLGSMYYLLRQYSTTPLPVPVSGGDTVIGEHLKERLVGTLCTAAVKEQYRNSRSLALYQLGTFIYSELTSGKPSKLLTEGMDILIATLKFPDTTLALVAVDMLTLISEAGNHFEIYCPSYVQKLLQGLSSACGHALSQPVRDSKVIISILMCLRDWLMALSIRDMIHQELVTEKTLKNIFKVIHAGVNIEGESTELDDIPSPLSVVLGPIDTTPPRTNNKSNSSMKLLDDDGINSINVAAKSVLFHLINLLSHFPFMGGPSRLSSSVCAYHDSPSLQYLDELSPEIFDSPRVQFFSINGNAILTVVEIPAESNGLPSDSTTANYQCRVIVRDITGKYCWDAGILYGSSRASVPFADSSSSSGGPVVEGPGLLSLIKTADSSESLLSINEELEQSSSSSLRPNDVFDPLAPPSWRTTPTNDTDLLHDLLVHVETTSPECILFPGQGLSHPAPSINESTHTIETVLQNLLDDQCQSEQNYQLETEMLPCMECESFKEPDSCPTSFAFHYCRLFLSHMGYLSWQKRNTIQLIAKNEQLIRELKHLDTTQAQSRQTYKVAVLYVGCGQEDKASILSNSKGSRLFEEFVAGLGWEVDMSTHDGYTGGLNAAFTAGCTMTYYASSTEEILFHVSTRMKSTGTDIGQKVRHLGNDEVHIVWSEHWRDYRRSIFKTQFADVLIIIYPLPNGLYRIQINKKNNIQFGPLFDGMVVDGANLSPLVRATALNALRAQRSPLYMYRGRYEDRWRYIQSITSNIVESCYEDFVQSVIHPLQSNTVPLSSLGVGLNKHSPLRPLLSSGSSSLPTHTSESSHSKLPKINSYPNEIRWTIPSPPPPLSSFTDTTTSSSTNQSASISNVSIGVSATGVLATSTGVSSEVSAIGVSPGSSATGVSPEVSGISATGISTSVSATSTGISATSTGISATGVSTGVSATSTGVSPEVSATSVSPGVSPGVSPEVSAEVSATGVSVTGISPEVSGVLTTGVSISVSTTSDVSSTGVIDSLPVIVNQGEEYTSSGMINDDDNQTTSQEKLGQLVPDYDCGSGHHDNFSESITTTTTSN